MKKIQWKISLMGKNQPTRSLLFYMWNYTCALLSPTPAMAMKKTKSYMWIATLVVARIKIMHTMLFVTNTHLRKYVDRIAS